MSEGTATVFGQTKGELATGFRVRYCFLAPPYHLSEGHHALNGALGLRQM